MKKIKLLLVVAVSAAGIGSAWATSIRQSCTQSTQFDQFGNQLIPGTYLCDDPKVTCTYIKNPATQHLTKCTTGTFTPLTLKK